MFGTETFLGKITRETRPEKLGIGYVIHPRASLQRNAYVIR
jgi:hypothetical protein